MNELLRISGMLVVTLKRIYAQKWLSLSILIGLAISIALVMSIPIYSDGVYYRILTEELAKISEGSRRPPFAFMFQYIRPPDAITDWEVIQPADSYLTESGASEIGLPVKSISRYFRTDDFKIFPENEIQYADSNSPLFGGNFAFASDIEDNINIIEGRFPEDAVSSQDSMVDILIHESLADQFGLQVGETYIAFAQRRSGETRKAIQIPIKISGIWEPSNPESDYWFYAPDTLKNNLIITEGAFFNRLSPYLDNEIYSAVWYLILDGSELNTSGVNPLLARINRVQVQVTELLPGTLFPFETERALSSYRQDAAELNFMLYVFSIPILSLMIVFLGLVVGLSVARQQNEIAVLRSRGGTEVQLIGMAALEAFILGFTALLIAIPLSIWIAYIVSNTRSFLDFSLAVDMRIILSPTVIRTGLMAVLVTVIAQVLPTIEASLHTIVTYKQERARAQRTPWWQRIWLDVLLLIPVGYGIFLMQQQGSIVSPLAEGANRSDPLQNPLFLLIPSITIFAFTLLVLRVLPILMSLITRITFRTKSIGVLMAARHLARTPGFYSAPLIMLILTFGLTTFIASLAQTLDGHLYSQQFYAYGSDMNLLELGESANITRNSNPFIGQARQDEDQDTNIEELPAGPRFFFLPVAEHLNIPGVEKATRIGSYPSFISVTGERQDGLFIGVDRAEFSPVAFWRDDFASASLGELMNRLALVSNGVLVDQAFLTGNGLEIGDLFRVETQLMDTRVMMDVAIVGVFEHFPTWYPQDDNGNQIPLVVGNLDHFFEQAEGTFPYDVWLRVSPDADYENIVRDANARGLGVLKWDAPLLNVAQDQRQPVRQGLFGVLSVGFLASIFLTVLGFFLYSFFSFRRRFVELGVLRAIGLSSRQMTRFLAWELIFLIFTGITIGTGLGIAVSNIFIPYLQIGESLIAQYPPFIVEISWEPIIPIYLLYGFLFLLALAVLVVLLMRMRVFEAVKLGETT